MAATVRTLLTSLLTRVRPSQSHMVRPIFVATTNSTFSSQRNNRFLSTAAVKLTSTKCLLQRLDEGVVVGDGSFVMTLEKRGYVSAGSWTPEAAALYPDAVRQLHREYLRAGADVMQTFTFYSSDDKIDYDRNAADQHAHDPRHDLTSAEINTCACDLAIGVANEGDALVAGGLSPLPGYEEKKGHDYVKNVFRKQCQLFADKGVDFLLGEFFAYAEEAEWAIEAMKEFNMPVACTMRICNSGDKDGNSAQECAVRMVKAGADVIGVNCMYDPDISLETVSLMKTGLESAGLKAHLMLQPVGFHTQEIAHDPHGYVSLPEFPFAMETRLLSRFDVQNFARKAYDLGVRYLGGCCGFEPYHIRAIAEELSEERGKRPPGAYMNPGIDGLKMSMSAEQRQRANRDYWDDIVPAAGRENVKALAEVEYVEETEKLQKTQS